MVRLTQSYAHGVSTTPLIGDTIGVSFDKSAERWPDRPALIVRQQNVRWTYRELQERVDAFAAGLLALGMAPGDRIGIWSPNNAEWGDTTPRTLGRAAFDHRADRAGRGSPGTIGDTAKLAP
jgi:fatty-acyl-CoA synthase